MEHDTPNELIELKAAALMLYDESKHERPDTTVLESELLTFQDLLKRSKPFLPKKTYNLLAEHAARVEVELEGFLMMHPNDTLLSSIDILYSEIESL